MNVRIILFLFLISFNSCDFDSDLESLSDGFEIGFVDSESNRNIYYRSQGVFRNKLIYGIYQESDFIAIMIHPKDSTYNIIYDSTEYYIIDIEKYKVEPNQEQSPGLIGPFNLDNFYIISKKMGMQDIIWQKYGK